MSTKIVQLIIGLACGAMLALVLAGCTTNVTIDNSVIDQSDVTQVLGCATDSVYGELE